MNDSIDTGYGAEERDAEFAGFAEDAELSGGWGSQRASKPTSEPQILDC